MAMLAESTAKKTWTHVSFRCGEKRNAAESSLRAITTATTGVQSPISNRTLPARTTDFCAKVTASHGASARVILKCNRERKRQMRINRSPKPGQLFGKVENRRCRVCPN
jgi:hypothetical protein